MIRISSHPAVVKVIALGTLFALELKAEGSDTGYDEIFCLSMILQKVDYAIIFESVGNKQIMPKYTIACLSNCSASSTRFVCCFYKLLTLQVSL